MERASLSRSKGSRCPCFFTTVSSRNCTRSKVVKRAAQFGQNRRRLIAPRSSVGRESFTWVSSAPQNGQRIFSSLFYSATLFVSLVFDAEFPIDRKLVAELPDTCAHTRFGCTVVGGSLRERAQHFDDVPPDGAELVRAETPGRCGWRAETDARGHRGLLRVERNAVLVAGDAGSLQADLGVPAGEPQRAQIHQHQMRVGPARDDLEPRFDEGRRQYFGVLDNSPRITPECRLQRLAQGDRLGGDHMHQRSALQGWEDSRADPSADLLVTGEDQPAPRPPQRLGRGGCDDVSVGSGLG